ncbi:MAG: hypothetical protein HZC41_01000 [Chloroflexi bacterium]|nr:hypothetical protein [Chloroflexota bacterium]
MNKRKWLIISLIIGLLLVGVGAVGAQDEPLRRGERLAREVAQVVAEAIGLTREQVADRLLNGETLADIIEAQGGSVDAVTAEVVVALTDAINAAVENGDLTQKRADRLLERLDEVVARVINGELPRRAVERAVQLGVLHLAADETGLLPREIIVQLRDGSTLADILTENGVDVNTFINDAAERLDTRLDRLVERGRITQERADDLLAQFRARLTERINRPGGAGGEG